MQIAPNGRMFFIDHNERKTSWVDPRTGRASPMPSQTRPPEDDLGSLPEGWEERVHADGRIFFIDHSEFCATIVCGNFPFQQSHFLSSSQIREPHSGRIHDCQIQILPAKQYLILEIISKNMNISRVNLENLWVYEKKNTKMPITILTNVFFLHYRQMCLTNLKLKYDVYRYSKILIES